jgi:7-cyano-7-deazaguanine synthase in queuosine biosynthesis
VDQELAAVQRTVPETAVLEVLSNLGQWEESDAYIYQRNAFLILAASKLAQPSLVYVTLQQDELSLPDRRLSFLDAMNQLFKALEVDSQVVSLWVGYDKTELFLRYVEQGGHEEDLANTWSCYSPHILETPRERTVVHCGNCAACVRRYIAFVNAFGRDLTVYAESPHNSLAAEKYYHAAKAGKYSSKRCHRILGALE